MKNYISYTFLLTLAVVGMVVALRYIPADLVRQLGLRSTNILSDLNQGNTIEDLDQLDSEIGAGESAVPISGSVVATNTTSAGYNVHSIVNTPDTADTASSGAVSTIHLEPDTSNRIPLPKADNADKTAASIVPIRDYTDASAPLASLFDKLDRIDQLDRPLRIAFMGDSFIEGDLITGDFREMMQDRFGGGGVGFVPITSKVSTFRQTVSHTFNDWSQRSIVGSKSGNFILSAELFIPAADNFVEYKGSRNKRYLDRFESAGLLFTSAQESVINIVVNDTEEYTFTTTPSDVLQQASVRGDIRSVRYTISQVEGFTAYGAFLDNDSGVAVDNLSVRGNPGTLMERISVTMSRQLENLVKYDLIVLEYGLNVVQSDVTDYSTYNRQMSAVVSHIKQCFVGVPILIMSVGDRSTRQDGNYVTMPGIKAMVKAQHTVAQHSRVAFWNTYDMMMAAGGMPTFVSNGWAAKDYTHIGAQGAKKIAAALFQAMMQAKTDYNNVPTVAAPAYSPNQTPQVNAGHADQQVPQ